MFERVKAMGSQIGTAATEAAASATDAAVRTAAGQLRSVLATAAEEFRRGPLPAGPVTLTASVGLGGTALQATVVIDAEAPPPLPAEPGEPPTAG